MNDQQMLERIAETDAYASTSTMPASAWSRRAALLEIERRIDMQTQDKTKPTPQPTRRSGILVAVVAFVAVLSVALAVTLLATRGNDVEPAAPPTTGAAPSTTEPAPTTTDATTTTVAELTVDAESAAFAQGLIADLNAGDTEAALARFPEDATFQSGYFTLLQLSKWFEYTAAVETEFELGDCKALSSGNTQCEWYGSSPHEPYYPDRSALTYQFRLEDGVPAFIALELVKSSWWETEVQFMNWLAENHPDVALELYVFPDLPTGGQKMNDPLLESELKKQYVPLWREAAGS